MKTLRRRNQHGATLASVLVGLAVASIAILGINDLFKIHLDQVARTMAALDGVELRTDVAQVLSNPTLCTCQLDWTTNLQRASYLRINTTQSAPPDIDLGLLRSSCDFSSDDNIIAAAGRPLPRSQSRLHVDSVRITGLKRIAANKYRGMLSIGLRSSTQGNVLAPVNHMVSFKLDPTTPPESRRIQLCSGDEDRSNDSCPPGFTMIGPPGAQGSYCIDTNERPPATDTDAKASCNAVIYNSHRAYVCTTPMLFAACMSGERMTNMTDNWEMSLPLWGSGVYVSMNGRCDRFGIRRYGNPPLPYRCCLY